MTRPNEYHWIFGVHSHLEFQNGGAPVNHSVGTPSMIDTEEGCASISDANGILLFYTDGKDLWDAGGIKINNVLLGGSESAAHSAIIIPPSNGGQIYHVFTVSDWDAQGVNSGPVNHTQVSVQGGVTILSGAQPVPGSPLEAGEQLVAVPTLDCNGWWLICIDHKNDSLIAFHVDGDNGIVGTPQASNYPNAHHGFCAKASHNGKQLAFTHQGGRAISLFDFDRATGVAIHRFSEALPTLLPPPDRDPRPYGIEFSPNNDFLFFTRIVWDEIFVLDIANQSVTVFSAVSGADNLGALQLAPDGKIYGIKVGRDSLFAIENSNLGVGATLIVDAVDANGIAIEVDGQSRTIGLPTFARLPDDCLDGNCSRIADEVDTLLGDQSRDHVNVLATCTDDDATAPRPNVDLCTPLEFPDITPQISITWGASDCDCIESDDLEVMSLTVCNPYSNVSLDHFTIHRLLVVDDHGNPVATLPDGTPSVQLVPIGPYCFGDIGPCSCVSREFALRNRGAMHGGYEIRVEGICFDANFHLDTDACFRFSICED